MLEKTPVWDSKAGKEPQGPAPDSQSVPEGLTFRDLGDGKGLIEGSPTHAGSAAMRVEALNRGGRSAQMTATLIVADKPAPAQAEKPATSISLPASRAGTDREARSAAAVAGGRDPRTRDRWSGL